MIGGPNGGQTHQPQHAVRPQHTSQRHKRNNNKTLEPYVRHSGCKSWEELGTRSIDLPAVLASIRAGDGGQAPDGIALKGSCRPKPPEVPQAASAPDAPDATEEQRPGPLSAEQLPGDPPAAAAAAAASSVDDATGSPGAVPSPDTQEAVRPPCDDPGLERSTSSGPEEPRAGTLDGLSGAAARAAAEGTEEAGEDAAAAPATAAAPDAPAATPVEEPDEPGTQAAAASPAAPQAAPCDAAAEGPPRADGSATAAGGEDAAAQPQEGSRGECGTEVTGLGGTSDTSAAQTQERIGGASSPLAEVTEATCALRGVQEQGHVGEPAGPQGAAAAGPSVLQQPPPGPSTGSCNYIDMNLSPFEVRLVKTLRNQHAFAQVLKEAGVLHEAARPLKRKFNEEQQQAQQQAAEFAATHQSQEQQLQEQQERRQRQEQQLQQQLQQLQQLQQQQQQQPQTLQQQQGRCIRMLNGLQSLERRASDRTVHLLIHKHVDDILQRVDKLVAVSKLKQVALDADSRAKLIGNMDFLYLLLNDWDQVLRELAQEAKPLTRPARPLQIERYHEFLVKTSRRLQSKGWIPLKTAQLKLQDLTDRAGAMTGARVVPQRQGSQGSQGPQQRQQSTGRRLQQQPVVTSGGAPSVQAGQAAASAPGNSTGPPQESLSGSSVPAHLQFQFQEWQQQQRQKEQQGQHDFAHWQQEQQQKEQRQQSRVRDFLEWKQRQQQASSQEQQPPQQQQQPPPQQQQQPPPHQQQPPPPQQQQPQVLDLTADDIMPAAPQPQVFFQPPAAQHQPSSGGGPAAAPSQNPGLVQRQVSSGFSLQQLPPSLQQPIQEAQRHLVAGMGPGAASLAHNTLMHSASMPQARSQVTGMPTYSFLPQQQFVAVPRSTSMPLQQGQQPATVTYVTSPAPREQGQHASVAFLGTHVAQQQQQQPQQHVVLQQVHVPQQQQQHSSAPRPVTLQYQQQQQHSSAPRPVTLQYQQQQQQRSSAPQPVTVQYQQQQQQQHSTVPQPVTVQYQQQQQHHVIQQPQQQLQGTSSPHHTQLPAAVPTLVASGTSAPPSTQEQQQEESIPQQTVTSSGSAARMQQPTPDGANAAAGSAPRAAEPSPAAPSQKPLTSAPSPSSQPARAGSGDSSSSVGGTGASAGQLTWLISQMQGIVKIAMDHDSAFVDPVTDEIAPNYSKYISKPICLKDISRKLGNGEYLKLGNPKNVLRGFRDDLKLMINNCLKYNPPDNQYHKKGVDMWNLLKNLIKVMSFGVQAAEHHNDDH